MAILLAERIAIARALIRNPRVLLLDEVSSHIVEVSRDFSTRSRLLPRLTRLRRGLSKKHWIRLRRAGPRSPSLTDFRRFRTPTGCKCLPMQYVRHGERIANLGTSQILHQGRSGE